MTSHSSMQRSRARPDPVSCQTCRTKKLKCNRVQPCSNCVSRGITCTFLVPPQSQTQSSAKTPSNAELLDRIAILEAAVLQPISVECAAKYAAENNHLTTPLSLNTSSEAPTHSNFVQINHRDGLSDQNGLGSLGVAVPHSHEKQDQDSLLLENIGTREDSLLPCLSDGLAFSICSTQEILGSRINPQQPTPVSRHDRLGTIVTFPTCRVATLLFQSYESHIDHMCRILHIPTTRSLLKTFYLKVTQRDTVLPGQAALLLSIFAIATYFYQPFSHSEVVTTEQDAIHLSRAFCKGALDVLDYSRRNTSGTLEDVQASIIMSLITYHLDGFSARGRLLEATAVSIARDLRLHRLDADRGSRPEKDSNPRALIDRELKRRVFWYVASADWLLSAISGPQEGMYLVHPNHVDVELPKDCTDDDIMLGEDCDLIASQPTGMTLFLERVRLGHLCREMADIVPLETSKLMQLPYEQITILDNKLTDFISNLPFFFRLDAESRQRSKSLEAVYPMIPVWRYCINTAAHSRRCKLHQRFLLRQSWDPRYVYSRQACLEAARTVIHVYEDISSFYSPSATVARMGMAVHFTHLALVVMVMDLCFNRGEADEGTIKADVKAALQIFEDAKDVSPLHGRFSSSLMGILQKHNVHLTDDPTSTVHQAPVVTNNTQCALLDTTDEDQTPSQYGLDVYDQNNPFDASFDEFWQNFQSEPNLDSLTWDNLFSSLDTRPM